MKKACILFVCAALTLTVFAGCMGFGGSQKIAAKRVEGDVVGPKKQQGRDTFKWPAYNGPKKRVAVGVVDNGTAHPRGRAMAKGITAELNTVLLATKRFVVLERREQHMKKSLDEQDMGAAGMTHRKLSPKGGKLIGAAYSIDATIVRLQDRAGGGGIGGAGASNKGIGALGLTGKRSEVEIQVQIKDNQTGQIIASITGESYDAKGGFGLGGVKVNNRSVGAGGFSTQANTSIARAAKRAVREAVLSIVNTLGKKQWKGVIIDVPDDTRIALKGGKDMNLRTGMRLKVRHKVKELTDPTTGQSLGFDTKEVATVVISRVLDKASFAKLESGSLEDVEVGDFLNMIQAKSSSDKGGDASKL